MAKSLAIRNALKSRPRIGLVFRHSMAFSRDVVRGIRAFSVERPAWMLVPIEPDVCAIRRARARGCCGFIAHDFSRAVADALIALDKPVVGVAQSHLDLSMSRVIIDHQEVGRIAARHFLDRGLNRFGFVGYRQHEFSELRELGFRQTIEAAGAQLVAFHQAPHGVHETSGLWRWDNRLINWLKSMPTPIGILTSHDTQALQVSEYCHHLDLRVPDDVAILGVDNDELLCALSSPPLSSVALPSQRIGYEAARLLDDHLRRPRSRLKKSVTVSPVGVVIRQSSDVLAVQDMDVQSAVRFIRDHARERITVKDVMRHVPVGRRTLERRFRKHLRRSISDEIRCARIDHCQRLLAETDLSMEEIAGHSGFYNGRHLSVVFRSVVGTTPSAYRRRNRLRS